MWRSTRPLRPRRGHYAAPQQTWAFCEARLRWAHPAETGAQILGLGSEDARCETHRAGTMSFAGMLAVIAASKSRLSRHWLSTLVLLPESIWDWDRRHDRECKERGPNLTLPMPSLRPRSHLELPGCPHPSAFRSTLQASPPSQHGHSPPLVRLQTLGHDSRPSRSRKNPGGG